MAVFSCCSEGSFRDAMWFGPRKHLQFHRHCLHVTERCSEKPSERSDAGSQKLRENTLSGPSKSRKARRKVEVTKNSFPKIVRPTQETVGHHVVVFEADILELPRTKKLAQYAGNQRSLFPLDYERLLRNGALAKTLDAGVLCVPSLDREDCIGEKNDSKNRSSFWRISLCFYHYHLIGQNECFGWLLCPSVTHRSSKDNFNKLWTLLWISDGVWHLIGPFKVG